MSIFEYDKEEEDKKLRKAEYEAGYDTGFDAGKQTGLEVGISKGKKEIIQLMLDAGEPLEKIVQYTGYTAEEIKELKEEMRG